MEKDGFLTVFYYCMIGSTFLLLFRLIFVKTENVLYELHLLFLTFSMVSQIAGAGKQKNNIIIPVIGIVGIKFVISSAGKLYPGLPGLKNIDGLKVRKIASHL